MLHLQEMDEHVTYREQLQGDAVGPVVMINRFTVSEADIDRFLEVWAEDAAFMKRQAGCISTQLHRGITGSTTFVNTAIWESVAALRAAFTSPVFQGQLDHYPGSVVASPHVFEKVAVAGICVA